MRLHDGTKIVLGVLGGGLAVLGGLGVLTGVMWMIDPIGTQLSNDADPFAAPPTFEHSAWLTGASFGAFLLGGWLCVGLARRS